MGLLGDKNPVHLKSAPGSTRKKYQHVGDHIIRNGRARTDAKGPSKRSDRLDRSLERDREETSNIKAEAGMCYLRGQCYAKQNAFDRAKECYRDAVQIDVQCFEAFDALMKNSLMTPQEEWAFLETLDFENTKVGDGTNASASQQAGEFMKMLYTTRLSKYSHPTEFTTATETLSTHYNLGSNPDILLSKASLLFTQCRFRAALEVTSSILEMDPYNFPTLPVHLACLNELGEKNALYLLAHNLADTHPSEPSTYLAIGVYYLTINQIAQARRFFSKASIMDPHYGPAWIGFAHTFAAEGEHDQAISAYSTAARLFQGTHLPSLFLGMQNLQLGNLRLAREYLNVAWSLCKTDPLLLNELGVAFYHEDRMNDAISAFQQALETAADIDSDPRAWISTRANLAHALRRAGRLSESLEQFNEVLRTGGKDAGMFSAKALVLLELAEPRKAIVPLHQALALSPQDPIATDLLTRAIAEIEEQPVLGAQEEENVDRALADFAVAAAAKQRRTRRRAHRQSGAQIAEDAESESRDESMAVD